MARDSFDVYKVVIEDTNEINSRRQSLDALYVAIITLLLSGDAYVFANSQFNSWLQVIETAAISLVGIAIVGRWREALKELKEQLVYRYSWLRALEETEELKGIGANVFSQEDQEVFAPRERPKFWRRRFGFAARTQRLQRIFRAVFVLIPALFALITFAASDPTLRPFIHLLVPTPTH